MCSSILSHISTVFMVFLNNLNAILCVCVRARVCVRCTSFITPTHLRTRALISEKLTKLILQNGCISYPPTSWRKLTLIQKPSAQIHIVFHEYGTAENTKRIQVKVFQYSQLDSILILEISTLSTITLFFPLLFHSWKSTVIENNQSIIVENN